MLGEAIGFRDLSLLAADGGPLAMLERTELRSGVRPYWLARAWLRPELDSTPGDLCGEMDASAVALQAEEAEVEAASEALSLWVRGALGFHAWGIPGAIGLVARQGLTLRSARAEATRRALGRLAIMDWWSGGLDGQRLDAEDDVSGGLLLRSHYFGLYTVLIWTDVDPRWRAYGWSAAASQREAWVRAHYAMERESWLLSRWLGEDPPSWADIGLAMRRRVFFAKPEGRSAFSERMRRRVWRQGTEPTLLSDGAVSGPWSRHAHAWLVRLRDPECWKVNQSEEVFLW